MAVAILATMALAIYRFVQSNLIALRLSSETLAGEARYDGLREVLAAQWQSLSAGKGALLGDAFKLNDRERDEIRWTCSAGPGLMTRYAAGDFVVALRLQSEKKDGDRLDLGFLRKPKGDSALTNANAGRHGHHATSVLVLLAFVVSAPLVLRTRFPLSAWAASAAA